MVNGWRRWISECREDKWTIVRKCRNRLEFLGSKYRVKSMEKQEGKKEMTSDNWGITTFYCISRSSFALSELFSWNKIWWILAIWNKLQFGFMRSTCNIHLLPPSVKEYRRIISQGAYTFTSTQLENIVGSLIKVWVSWLEHSIIEKRVQLHWNLSCFRPSLAQPKSSASFWILNHNIRTAGRTFVEKKIILGYKLN